LTQISTSGKSAWLPSWVKNKLNERAQVIAGALWGAFFTAPERIAEFILEGTNKFAVDEKKRE